MKRNMDLIRDILLEIEKQPDRHTWFSLQFEGVTLQEIDQHLLLLEDAGFIRLTRKTASNEDTVFAARLTWQGHEFLEAIKADERWERLKTAMAGTGGFVAEVAKAIALSWMKADLGLEP
jgi:DNA-binding HxlR family transcriptional regulator